MGTTIVEMRDKIHATARELIRTLEEIAVTAQTPPKTTRAAQTTLSKGKDQQQNQHPHFDDMNRNDVNDTHSRAQEKVALDSNSKNGSQTGPSILGPTFENAVRTMFSSCIGVVEGVGTDGNKNFNNNDNNDLKKPASTVILTPVSTNYSSSELTHDLSQSSSSSSSDSRVPYNSCSRMPAACTSKIRAVQRKPSRKSSSKSAKKKSKLMPQTTSNSTNNNDTSNPVQAASTNNNNDVKKNSTASGSVHDQAPTTKQEDTQKTTTCTNAVDTTATKNDAKTTNLIPAGSPKYIRHNTSPVRGFGEHIYEQLFYDDTYIMNAIGNNSVTETVVADPPNSTEEEMKQNQLSKDIKHTRATSPAHFRTALTERMETTREVVLRNMSSFFSSTSITLVPPTTPTTQPTTPPLLGVDPKHGNNTNFFDLMGTMSQNMSSNNNNGAAILAEVASFNNINKFFPISTPTRQNHSNNNHIPIVPMSTIGGGVVNELDIPSTLTFDDNISALSAHTLEIMAAAASKEKSDVERLQQTTTTAGVDELGSSQVGTEVNKQERDKNHKISSSSSSSLFETTNIEPSLSSFSKLIDPANDNKVVANADPKTKSTQDEVVNRNRSTSSNDDDNDDDDEEAVEVVRTGLLSSAIIVPVQPPSVMNVPTSRAATPKRSENVSRTMPGMTTPPRFSTPLSNHDQNHHRVVVGQIPNDVMIASNNNSGILQSCNTWNSGRHSTPTNNSRTTHTTESSSNSFEQWQAHERLYWSIQREQQQQGDVNNNNEENCNETNLKVNVKDKKSDNRSKRSSVGPSSATATTMTTDATTIAPTTPSSFSSRKRMTTTIGTNSIDMENQQLFNHVDWILHSPTNNGPISTDTAHSFSVPFSTATSSNIGQSNQSRNADNDDDDQSDNSHNNNKLLMMEYNSSMTSSMSRRDDNRIGMVRSGGGGGTTTSSSCTATTSSSSAAARNHPPPYYPQKKNDRLLLQPRHSDDYKITTNNIDDIDDDELLSIIIHHKSKYFLEMAEI